MEAKGKIICQSECEVVVFTKEGMFHFQSEQPLKFPIFEEANKYWDSNHNRVSSNALSKIAVLHQWIKQDKRYVVTLDMVVVLDSTINIEGGLWYKRSLFDTAFFVPSGQIKANHYSNRKDVTRLLITQIKFLENEVKLEKELSQAFEQHVQNWVLITK